MPRKPTTDDHNLPLLPILLPSVPFAERATLPKTSGIYFALGKHGEVLYVGQSKNIYNRWVRQHPQKITLDACDCEAIAYFACPETDLQCLERSMILQFTPPLNGHPGRPRGRGLTFVEVQLDSRDSALTTVQFRQYLQQQAFRHGSQAALAQYCGVGEAYMSEIMRGTRAPGPKVLRMLGFQKVVRFERLEPEAEVPGSPV